MPTQPYPGWRFAYAVRRFLVRFIFKSCGRDVIIKNRAYFGTGKNLVLGDRSQLGERCKVEDDLVVGDDVIMGPDVFIMSSAHAFERLDIPINQQGAQPRRPVVIGNDVWIGARVIILPGVHVGDQAVIGAGAVVTKDVPPRAVACGVPARVVRFRGERVRTRAGRPASNDQRLGEGL
ncbi:MAG: acyltransferase [Bacillota bacterium]